MQETYYIKVADMASWKRCKDYHEHIYWEHNYCKRCKEYHEHIYWEHNYSGGLRFQMTMIGDCSRCMSIPKKFLSRVDLLEIIDLKGPSGCLWHVGLAKRGSTVYLQYGWKEVIVYDSSRCKRECSYFARNEHGEIQEEREECSLKILELCPTPAHEVVGCSSASSPNASNFPKESSPTNNAQSGEDNYSGRKLQKGEKNQIPRSETVGESLLGNQTGNSTRKPATDTEKDHAMKLAGELRTNRPSFIAKMKGYNICNQFQLLIPPDFANEFLPQKSQEIVLQIPRERKEWKVNYCISPYHWQVEEFRP